MESIDLERLFVGIIFVVYGGINALIPEKMFSYRANFSKKLLGVSYKASKKTYKIYKIFGVLLVLIGFFLLTPLLV